jgi:hypothetical protein
MNARLSLARRAGRICAGLIRWTTEAIKRWRLTYSARRSVLTECQIPIGRLKPRCTSLKCFAISASVRCSHRSASRSGFGAKRTFVRPKFDNIRSAHVGPHG